MTKHTAVSLPKGMRDAIKKIIDDNPEMGYTSIAEFCKEAVRNKIAEINAQKTLKK